MDCSSLQGSKPCTAAVFCLKHPEWLKHSGISRCSSCREFRGKLFVEVKCWENRKVFGPAACLSLTLTDKDSPGSEESSIGVQYWTWNLLPAQAGQLFPDVHHQYIFPCKCSAHLIWLMFGFYFFTWLVSCLSPWVGIQGSSKRILK